jgi:hypothetical protein
VEDIRGFGWERRACVREVREQRALRGRRVKGGGHPRIRVGEQLTPPFRDTPLIFFSTIKLVPRTTSQLQNSSTPEAYRLDFSMYQPGIDFKCPYSNRPLKPLSP